MIQIAGLAVEYVGIGTGRIEAAQQVVVAGIEKRQDRRFTAIGIEIAHDDDIGITGCALAAGNKALQGLGLGNPGSVPAALPVSGICVGRASSRAAALGFKMMAMSLLNIGLS